MSLTIPQKKYLVKRIDEVANNKANALKDVSAVKNRQLCKEGIDAGRVDIRTRPDIVKIIENALVSTDGYGHWDTVSLGSIKIENLIIGWDDFLKENELDIASKNRKIIERRNAIFEEATKIKDKAMFGTEQEAYAMLDQFMEMEV